MLPAQAASMDAMQALRDQCTKQVARDAEAAAENAAVAREGGAALGEVVTTMDASSL